MYQLENDALKLECIERAGQMSHLIDKKNNTEILYQGDQGWSGRNPTLFPLVGNTYSGSYEINGRTYAMKNHGLIRYLDLKGNQRDDAIIFTYDADETTKAQYPFDFHYEMKYTLDGNAVHIDYMIKNTGVEVMPFSFGLHPAFRVPQREGETYEEYTLRFAQEENCRQCIFGNGPSHWENRTFHEWKVDRQDIYRYATIVYDNLKSKYVTLFHQDEARLRVHFDGFRYLALWTHPTPSDFLCIEPWMGHADYDDVDVDFYHREGTQLLEPNQSWSIGYVIEIL
ncbi:MAG: aldose 1-epimerase family protein [Catenisphaera adipataccumulans]|jgi:galactose mutarotase-like enzyme|uniref:aldose epimerase family protein n=1 Tax=Catenisphaera adipataccumulans TaxID=700500 RepID=UPI003D91E73C